MVKGSVRREVAVRPEVQFWSHRAPGDAQDGGQVTEREPAVSSQLAPDTGVPDRVTSHRLMLTSVTLPPSDPCSPGRLVSG